MLVARARGLINKQIAGDMHLSEITVKVHRAQAMRKMQARTFADLVRMEQRMQEDAASHELPREPAALAM